MFLPRPHASRALTARQIADRALISFTLITLLAAFAAYSL